MNDYFGCRAVVALVRWGGASALLFSGARDALDASNVIGNGPAERTGKPVVVVVFLDARRFASLAILGRWPRAGQLVVHP